MISDFESKRTIEEVLDLETGEIINSKEFFKRPEPEIYHYRRQLQEAIEGYSNPKFVCLYCNQLLRLTGKPTLRGKVLFFSHLHDSDECEIKTDGENSLSKEQIEVLKYSKIRESERHKRLKKNIYDFLTTTSSIAQGVSNVEIERRVTSNLPNFNWRQPDISFEYKGKRIVIELQLSTTFLSVIVERDIFYKMNGIFILWTFNFSDNQQYVNLGNMMCKDIYYSNKRNAFILDEAAINLSVDRQELFLKCIWFEPHIVKGIVDVNKSLRKEEFISLSKLTFDENNYKPFFVDADKLFEKYLPSSLIKRELEDEFIKRRLTEQIFKNDIILTPYKKYGNWGFVNESNNEVIPASFTEVLPFKYGISWVRKTYWGAINVLGQKVSNFQYRSIRRLDHKDYILAENKNKKFGLLSNEGYIIVPIEYNNIGNFENGQARVENYNGWNLIDENGYLITQNKTQIAENVVKGSRFQLWGLETNLGEIILPFEYSIIEDFVDGKASAEKNNQRGVVDLNGNVITENKTNITDEIIKCSKFGLWGLETSDGEILLPFHYSQIGRFFDGKVYAEKGAHWGIVDIQGNIIIPFDYSSISDFIDNKAIVKKDRLLGMVDNQGNIVIPVEYSEISEFVDYKAIARKSGLLGVVDSQGNIIIPFEYSELGDLSGGKVRAKKVTKKTEFYPIRKYWQGKERTFQNQREIIEKYWGVWSLDGKIAVPFKYDYITEFFDGKARAKKDGLWGLIDVQDQILIPFEYSEIGHFVQDKAIAKRDNNWGVIDSQGKTVIPFDYSKLRNFVDGKALAQKGYLWGVIDIAGKILIPYRYAEICDFLDGKAKARKDGQWGVIDTLGNTVIPFEYSEFGEFNDDKAKARKDGFWGVLDTLGKIIIPFEYREISDFVDGKAKARKGDLWGVIDNQGNVLVEWEYNFIGDFVDGSAQARKGNHWGIIDYQGNIITENITYITDFIIKGSRFEFWGLESITNEILLPFEYNRIDDFIEGKAKVLKDGRFGVVDKEGRILIPNEYSEIGNFIDGKTIAEKVGLWGVIESKGEIVVPFKYSKIYGFFDGKSIARKDGFYGVIDIQGNILVPFDYSKIYDFVEGVAKAEKNNTSGIIDYQGNIITENKIHITEHIIQGTKFGLFGFETTKGEVILSFEYSKITHFQEGKAIAYKDGHCGVIDEQGQIVIPFEYKWIKHFVEGKAIAKQDGNCGVIDELAQIVIPFEYSWINDFVNGKSIARKDGLSGVIDEQGQIVIPFEYASLMPFSNGKLKAAKDEYWGIIDEKGQIVIPLEYSSIMPFCNGKLKAAKDEYWGVIDELGHIVIPFEYSEIDEDIDGKVKVIKNGQPGVLDDQGKELVEVTNHLFNGWKIGKKFEKFGVLSKTDATIIPFEYDGIYLVNNTFMMVCDGSLYQHSCIGLIEENYLFRVTGKADFGVFFHIPSNFKGLLHISEIKRSGQNLVDFNIGTSYGLYIKSFDVSRNKVSFSLFPANLSKRNHLEVKHNLEGIKVGDVVSGKVTGVKEYGVFVKIVENTIGLIHWTELKKYSISKSDFVVGSQIEVIIIAIDKQTKKISLTCKIDY